MTLNKNNWFAIYYNWIYLSYPKDVCSFFWGSVIAILLGPFVIPGLLLAIANDDYSLRRSTIGQTVIGIVIYLMLFLIAGLGNAVLSIFGYEFIYLWSIILGGIGLGILFLLFGIAIGYSIFLLIRKSVGAVPQTHIIDNTIDFVAAIKGKYCTKITWKDEK